MEAIEDARIRRAGLRFEFFDGRPYRERLETSRKTTGAKDAMAIGFGAIRKQPAVVLVQDFAFMGGSLGIAAGEAFITAAQEAVKRGVPLVVFTASGGARMQEGTLSLMQLARTTLAVQDLKKAQLPYIVVLTHPTTGGVTASYAMLGDVHLAEPGAYIAFAGQRVIEQTIREALPAGFQRPGISGGKAHGRPRGPAPRNPPHRRRHPLHADERRPPRGLTRSFLLYSPVTPGLSRGPQFAPWLFWWKVRANAHTSLRAFA